MRMSSVCHEISMRSVCQEFFFNILVFITMSKIYCYKYDNKLKVTTPPKYTFVGVKNNVFITLQQLKYKIIITREKN